MSPEAVVAWLNGLPPEAVLVGQIGGCFAGLLLLYRQFGAAGLYVFIAVAVIGANVEVLKAVQFGLYSHPVALGTVLFGSTYLATDLLAEVYGPAAARRGVFLGFAAFLLWTVLMVVALGFRPLSPAETGAEMAWALPAHGHMAALFLPAPALLVAGMTAYFTSQLFDIWVYQRLRRATGSRWLWLRNNGSTWASGLIDNAVFSVLAWVVLAAEPIGWQPLVFTYILGTYGLRVAVALLDTPVLYLARRRRPPDLAFAHAVG